MYGMRFVGFVRHIVALVAVFWTLIQWRTAEALQVKKPEIMQGGADTSQVDSATTEISEFILYFAYSLSAITIVIGLTLCLEIVGQPQLGKKTLKSGLIVFLAIGTIHILFGFLGGLFG